MSNNLEKLPPGYFHCVWCRSGNRYDENGKPPMVCFNCGLNPMPGEDPTKGGKVDPDKAVRAKRNRKSSPLVGTLGTEPLGKPVLGIDPGARYTGVVIRDGDVVLHSSTLVRPETIESGTEWALSCVTQVLEIVQEYGTIPVGIEGISDPKGFQHGKKAAINPKDIIRAGIVLGALVVVFPNAAIIPPGKNGSKHYSHYPSVLIGRRPSDLPGSSQSAGTRGHEQSAYDVAGKASELFYPKEYDKIDLS